MDIVTHSAIQVERCAWLAAGAPSC